ncbi:MAG: NAD(P)H-dependent oxidoreductase [Oscillospiraceae bacterium]|jgi:multimeric flavodoxin WrbA|nr:NAD(P)H-dependent oxidoreductase [Oscillospiraceae bacterium]
MSKTLIINGSPRADGDTTALLRRLRLDLRGECTELSAYRANISPCVDCRSCWTVRGCVIDDDMRVIYADDFDNVVIASPIYLSNLPGPLLSVASRFQIHHGAEHKLHDPFTLRPKKAGLILVGGGSKGDKGGALHSARVMFRMMNARGFEEHTVLSLRTDMLPAALDASALEGVSELARWLRDAE